MVCTIPSLWAQNVRVVVSDNNSNQPLSGVTASNNEAVMATSNDKGELTLACNGASYTFTLEGYSEQMITLSNCSAPVQVKLSKSNLLNQVQVTGDRVEPGIDIAPLENVAVVNREVLQQQTGLFMNESMNRVSGVRVENRTASGGQRITIRGYGNTERFNGYGYRAYLNGIPVTDAEGITILDDIDPSMLQSISVLKGPNSTRYGNGIAGTVLFESYKPQEMGARVSQEITAGSFGLLRSNTRFESKSDRGSVVLNYGYQSYDGYRVHSNSTRQFISILGDVNLGNGDKVDYYFSYHNTDEQLAGQLDSTEFFNQENIGEARYLANDASVVFEGFRSALGYSGNSGNWSYRANVFATSNDQTQAYAVGLNRNSKTSIGGRGTLGWTSDNGKWDVVIGTEVQSNLSLLSSYGYNNAVITGRNSDVEFTANNTMAFGEVTFRATDALRFTVGMSATDVAYSINDRMSWDTTHLDGSGELDFGWQPAPRIQAEYDVTDNFTAHASYSSGFAAPTSSHIVIAEIGEVNSDLKSEIGSQIEVGFRGEAMDSRLNYSANVYMLSIDRKLTSEAITDTAGSVLYSRSFNAGGQSNFGIEADVSYDIIRNPNAQLSVLNVTANYSYSNHTYVDFYSDANQSPSTEDYSGNQVSGVPPHVFNAVLSAELMSGFYANVGYQFVDQMPINFNNDAHAPSFSLLNAKVGYRYDANRWSFDAYVGGQNLSNSLYYNMVILNQAPRFGNAPKVFLPGSYTATFFGGLKVSYRL